MKKFEMTSFMRFMESWNNVIIFIDKREDDLFAIQLINEKTGDRYVSDEFSYDEMVEKIEEYVQPYLYPLAQYIKRALFEELLGID